MNHFQQSCGAAGPLRVVIDGRSWAFPRPFAVIGRDLVADVVLDHPHVSRSHLYLQVIQGRLFFVDLGSRTGVHREDGRPAWWGWIEPGEHLRIGPYEIRASLDGGPAARPSPGSAGLPNPLEAAYPGPEPRLEIGPAPSAEESGNGAPMHAPLRCALTLLGTSSRCGMRVPDRSASRFHCGFLRTATGTWVVDLLGRHGIAVNDMGVRFARLAGGDRLRFGRFTARLVDESDGPGGDGATDRAWSPTATASTTPLLWSRSLAPSNDPPASVPALPAHGARSLSPPLLPRDGRLDVPAVSHLLGQVSLMHGQMLNNYNQSMMMAVQMFVSMCREESGGVREDLKLASGLVEELRALKESVASRLAESKPRPPAPEPRSARRAEPRPATPPARPAPRREREGEGGDPPAQSYQEMCVWLCQRAELMDGEQQDRWRRILNSILGVRGGK